MSDSPATPVGPPLLLQGPLGRTSRRGSLASLYGSTTPLDKEQLSQALDRIHTSACQSQTLTTFNEFASPPSSSSASDNKGISGDSIQNGISGLYNRFRGAVGGGKERPTSSASRGDSENMDNASITSLGTPISKSSVAPAQVDSGKGAAPSSRLQSPTTSSQKTSSSEASRRPSKSSKTLTALGGIPPKSGSSSRPPMNNAISSSATIPVVATVNVNAFKGAEKGRQTTEDLGADAASRPNKKKTLENDPQTSSTLESKSNGLSVAYPNSTSEERRSSELLPNLDVSDRLENKHDSSLLASQNEAVGGDGSLDLRERAAGTSKAASSTLIQNAPPRSNVAEAGRRLAVVDRISHPRLPAFHPSRASSADRSTSGTSSVTTPAHNIVRHENFSAEEGFASGYQGRARIPGTTTNEGGTEAISTKLETMRRQVLSNEFWMADEICKDCFLCGDSFSVLRRKHHCRTCGCIFDSKCTSFISGQRFGVQGSLRVCKTCLEIINRRHDSSGSEESADDSTLPTFFQSQQAKFESSSKMEQSDRLTQSREQDRITGDDNGRPLATPMMAIPATRRVGESANSRSLVLDIEAPQLGRPSSSRSLKTLSAGGRPASSSHKRHHSKNNFLGRFRSAPDERAPFHRGATDEVKKGSRLPAFHDDNIIDPDLAPYMSDEGSSADEQTSIFATMNGTSPVFENDRSGFGSLLSAGKRHRARTGDKSVSGISFTTRGIDENSGGTSAGAHGRPNRRRNLSAASNTLHHSRGVSRLPAQGFAHMLEDSPAIDPQSSVAHAPSRLTRSASMRDGKAPAVELNAASLHHVRRLLHQLLQDAHIPNIGLWEKALIPILLRCTDDVNPDIRRGDDIDIRHYVKLKKIPGGRPGDTSYVSGVVFTKNLALKSMPRSISNPRIVIVSFPIEYSRHQQHYMSLEPVIAQEKDFLRNMVARLASLRPQLLLVQKSISGLALQYLAEANIAVAYNVKKSVIEAVSRCAQTEIISSIDMIALKPVHIGKSAAFEVKTYVNKDIPGKKKTYIYLSGCPKELGCTINLRGANMAILSKMKRITEFMVYVVYNLKLETCLMRDEFVLIPSNPENGGNASPIEQQISQPQLVATRSDHHEDSASVLSDKTQKASESMVNGQKSVDAINPVEDGEAASRGSASAFDSVSNSQTSDQDGMHNASKGVPKVVSAHESHSNNAPEDQLPEDIPMPTFYSDMVDKHQTKILSASPFVRFMQPYLLMRARELERRLVYLKRLRDQDTFEESTENEKAKPQKFQLIRPEMVHETVRRAPKQIMEVLHAVHDAEYDKALHNYQTQKRQWENYIQGNINLFDPYAHQNITVLYTVVCTETTIPCAGPELLALAFYNEHEVSRDFDPDCTLGQYVEDLCLSANTVCTSHGCDRKMSEHHRTYVHGEARITVFVEKSPCKIKGLQDSILMWSYCKSCKKETQVMPMSESTWKYSLGKYLELSFWSSELRLRAGFCPHDIHREHLRYFGFRNVAIRIHYDPIDLLEIVVPRARITWKVDNDLKLKNDMFNKIEERWNRFMNSVKSRIKGINIESVLPEKAEACKVEIERLTKLAQEEHVALTRKLQAKYMESKYYEIIPLNRALRAMQEKVAEWDEAFASFDANFFPSEKDIRRLAALQLKKMFLDRDEGTPAEVVELSRDLEENSPSASLELSRDPSNVSPEEAHDVLASVVEEHSTTAGPAEGSVATHNDNFTEGRAHDLNQESVEHLDLAIPQSPESVKASLATAICPDSPDAPVGMSDRAPSPLSDPQVEPTLSEKVDKLRRENSITSGNQLPEVPQEVSGIPQPSTRGGSRRGQAGNIPTLTRTQSQPAGTLRRALPSSQKSFPKQVDSKISDTPQTPTELLKASGTDSVKPADKKLSERLGLSNLNKAHRKQGHSLIPRSVQGKSKESKVTSLAKHFEQLSREFQKERLRDKKQRAARATQSRAFPKASSKPIVEVYKDVNEAVEERDPTDQDILAVQETHPPEEKTSVVEGLADLNTEETAGAGGPHSPGETAPAADKAATEIETDDNQPNVSQTASDDEGTVSDTEHSLLDDAIAGAVELGESLKPSTDMPLELPKHEKSSLMKMLTNFWAERSASGWTPLEYPINTGDHIFVDEDIIVREDEPSSLIAFTLQSQHYKAKLAEIRGQNPSSKGADATTQEKTLHDEKNEIPDICEDGIDQAEVETSLLRATGTHLAYSFVDSTARMQCKIFFAEQFDAVRRKCGVADRIVESLSRCLKWDSKGGKTKSVFLKTLDDRLVLKSLSPIETQAFLRFAPAYFNIMAEALFHDLPTAIAKMLGFYQIVIKNPATGTEIKWDVLIMENLFYDRAPNRIFDLKGSMRNRKIQSTGEQNEVLLDENMVEFIYESPLFAREHSKKLLRAAIFNDTLFLQRNDVMDYSLMVAVDESRKELVVGIIDVVRTYTWDKKLESWIKDRGFAGGGRNRPTVTSPKEYKSRFREAMNRYILQAPNSWHQWQPDARPTDPE